MEAISARLAYTRVCPAAHAMKPQNRSAVPPSVRTNPRYLPLSDHRKEWEKGRGTVRQNAFPAGYTRGGEAEHGDKTEVSLEIISTLDRFDLRRDAYTQHLLLTHDGHVPFVGRRSSVLLGDMTDAVVEDFGGI